MSCYNKPSRLGIVFDERPIKCTEIGHPLVLRELEPDFEKEAIELGIEFHPKERHFINLCYIKFRYSKLLKKKEIFSINY